MASGGPLKAVWNLRAWLIGFVVWVVFISATGLVGDDGEKNSGLAGGAALFAFLLLVVMVRIAWPIRTSPGNPYQLVGGCRNLTVHTFTGRVSDVTNRTHTTTGPISLNVTDTGGGYAGTAYGSTTHSHHKEFFLTADNGTAQGFHLKDVAIMLGGGQRVTAAWAVAPMRKTGQHIVFVNHTTGTDTFSVPGLARIAMGTRAGLAVLWALGTLLFGALAGSGATAALGILGLLFLAFGTRLQARLFRHGTSGALVKALRAAGAAPAAAHPVASPPAASTTTAAVPEPRPEATTVTSAPTPVEPPANTTTAAAPPPPPPPTATTAAPTAPPAWAADPHGRHEYRWWDGSRWTDHVSNNGVTGTDPV